MEFTRRESFNLLAGAAAAVVLSACGKSKPKGVTARTTTTEPGAASVVTEGPQAAHAPLMSASDARRQAGRGNGRWQGGWHDDAGRSGTSDIIVDIDAARQSARATTSFGGPILGTEVPDTIYDVYGLLSFMLDGTAYDVVSPQFGHLHIEPGEHSASATVTKVPGHPEIASADLALSTQGRRSDLTYAMHLTGGKTVKGTMAWSSAGVRAVPAPLGSAASPTPADVQTGEYAATLLTAAQVSAATGTPFAAAQPNGGKLQYATNIDVSNGSARSTSGRYLLQYSVYLGTPAAVSAFWKTELGSFPAIAGPWTGAFFRSDIRTFYGYVRDRAFTLQLVDTQATAAPDPAALATLTAQLTAIAKSLTATFAASS